MTNKEVLAELKICYELLNDIRENHEDRFNGEEETLMWKMEEQIDDLYCKVYKQTLESEHRDDDLKIKTKQDFGDEEIVIGNNVYVDYNYVKKGTYDFTKDEYGDFDYLTCEDLGYNWYFDELGYKHTNYEYDKLENDFTKALDEICKLSKETNKGLKEVLKNGESL